jgi:hypothetical protein
MCYGLLHDTVSNYIESNAGMIDKLQSLERKQSWSDYLVGNYLRNLMYFPVPLHTCLFTPFLCKQRGKTENRFINVECECDV